MSYIILYRSMFAKVGEDQYIPMIEVGDSNCYERRGRYERRERSWTNWRVPGFESKLILTRQQIMIGMNNLLDTYNKKYVNEPIHGDAKNGYWTYKSIEQNFGYLSGIAVYGKHTEMTTARMVANFFKRGFEQCLDLRQFENNNFGVFPINFKYYIDRDSLRSETKVFPISDGMESMVEFLRAADGNNTWIKYPDASADYMWDEVRIRKNR